MEDILNRDGVELVKFQRGDVLIKQGQLVTEVYYLQQGSCYRTSTSEGGNDVFYDYKNAYGSFYDATVGLVAAFSHDGTSDCHFVASDNICAYRIPVEYIFDYYESHPILLRNLIAICLEKNRQNIWIFNARKEGRVPNQLCKLMYFNSYLDNDGYWRVKEEYSSFIRLSQKLGVHKVTVSKMMRALRKENVLFTEGRQIFIKDRELLFAYAMNERQLSY